MGPIGCPETSVINVGNPEEHRSHLVCVGSPKSKTFLLPISWSLVFFTLWTWCVPGREDQDGVLVTEPEGKQPPYLVDTSHCAAIINI